MKKTNNKYRNNNSNQIFSLNYKFDSISVAGKISGTALDLIKKYNELAKEAHANNDYVTAEVFRQYAEHYRKIVTEINEKKNAQKIVNFPKENTKLENNGDNSVSNGNLDADSAALLCHNADNGENAEDVIAAELAAPVAEKKEFKIIEISAADAQNDIVAKETAAKPRVRRAPRKKEDKGEEIAI